MPDIRANTDGGLLALHSHSINRKNGNGNGLNLNIAVEDPLLDDDSDDDKKLVDTDTTNKVEAIDTSSSKGQDKPKKYKKGKLLMDGQVDDDIGTDNENENDDQGNDDKDAKEAQVPRSTWPVLSTNKQKDEWITLPHPGDPAMTVTVPPFWSKPIHNNKLMSRSRALSIGTCITPVEAKDGFDTVLNYQRGDACPLHERTIFVAIASYRDWQCKHTVTSIFERAKHPERVRVAVVDQIVDGDDVCDEPIDETCSTMPDQAICKYKDQIDVYTMDAPMAVGPVFARHIGHRQYRGEYYTMQSDAHVTFTIDWDVDIVEQQEATGDEMTVLTTYLTDIVGSIDPKTGKSLRNTRPIMCNTDYEGGPQGMHLRHMSQPEREPPRDLIMPQLSPWWAAGFSFSRGHFVVNVPYDFYQPMIFQGEEMSIGIRGFTIGYDYYAPMRSVCFHHYASMNKDRVNVPHFWENSQEYAGVGKKAMARLLGIVHMNPETDSSKWSHEEENFYGLGTVRTPEKFYETFGIDVRKKKTVKFLCRFVEGGKMHHLFMPNLRSDGMGIDYSKITYKHS